MRPRSLCVFLCEFTFMLRPQYICTWRITVILIGGKPEYPQFEPHAGIKMAHFLGSTVYICGFYRYVREGRVRGWGALNFFSGRSVQPRFPKCGACELICFWKRGLVNWKFPNLGAWELRFGQKLSCIEVKIWVLWTDSFAWNGT